MEWIDLNPSINTVDAVYIGKYLNFSTVFSQDRIYRYTLVRELGFSKKTLFFLCLNPSIADEVKNDPTVTRCIGYAKSWGFGRLFVGNIFAYRSTDPAHLYTINDPVGIENDKWIEMMAEHSDLTVGAWGNHGHLNDRYKEVLNRINNVYCLKKTKSGQPSHPLYLAKKLKPFPFT